jgi:hypothetical protein
MKIYVQKGTLGALHERNYAKKTGLSKEDNPGNRKKLADDLRGIRNAGSDVEATRLANKRLPAAVNNPLPQHGKPVAFRRSSQALKSRNRNQPKEKPKGFLAKVNSGLDRADNAIGTVGKGALKSLNRGAKKAVKWFSK